jgi:hypothetical protein
LVAANSTITWSSSGIGWNWGCLRASCQAWNHDRAGRAWWRCKSEANCANAAESRNCAKSSLRRSANPSAWHASLADATTRDTDKPMFKAGADTRVEQV